MNKNIEAEGRTLTSELLARKKQGAITAPSLGLMLANIVQTSTPKKPALSL